jgi:large subunit ribosomal protein L10
MSAEETRRGAVRVQPYKIEAKDSLKETLAGCGDVVFADFRGLTVAQITELRRGLRAEHSALRVVKNSYARRAFGELGIAGADAYLTGPTALAIAESDGGPVAKLLFEYARTSALQVKGGYCGGRLLSQQEVDTLSRLPGKGQLLAMLMGAMKAPMSNLVYALSGVTQKLLRTLVAVQEKKAKEAA